MGKKREVTPSVEPSYSPTPEPTVVDPYADLRYAPLSPRRRKSSLYSPKTKPGLVFKRKTLPAIAKTGQRSSKVADESRSVKSDVGSQEQKTRTQTKRNKRVNSANRQDTTSAARIPETESAVWTQLDDRAMAPPRLTAWVSPGEMPTIPPPIQLIHKAEPLKPCYLDSIDTSFYRECSSLEAYTQAQDERFRLEKYLMSKTGRKRGELVLRRSQLLPKSSPDGRESPLVAEERMVTPEMFPLWAFFNLPAVTRTGLYDQQSKIQRGFDVVHDWRGRPAVTDELLEKLGLSSKCLKGDGDSPRAESNVKGEAGDGSRRGKYVTPYMPALGVVGRDYKSTQSTLKELAEEKMSKIYSKDENSEAGDDKESIRQKSEWFSVSCLLKPLKTSGELQSRVSLTFGEHKLAFTNDEERAANRWIVEVGCSAEVGENSISYVHMQNTGTTAIHYNWVKTAHEDPLQLYRYEQIRFVFDSWGGTILPGEIFRVPFLYKSKTTGYYSEDWRLHTRPVLENGAEIILRLWGLSRQYDPYFLARDEIDESIKARVPWNIVQNRVTKIVDYLPLQESTFKDTRFAIIDLGPDLFRSKNPGLHYNTGPVYRLGKLHEMLEIRKFKRGDFGPDQDDDDDTDTGEDSASYPSSNEDLLESLQVDGGEEHEDGQEQDSQGLEVDYGTHSELSVSNLKGTYSKMIARAADIIRKRIDPDVPALKDYRRSLASLMDEEPEQLESYGSSKKVPKAPINLVNVDFTVEEMRTDILRDTTSLEVQEALFNVMSTEVDRLYFRNFDAKEDWKGTAVFTLLVKALDDFEDFAQMLKTTCCEAETTSQRQAEERARLARLEAEAEMSVISDTEEKSAGATKTPTTSGTTKTPTTSGETAKSKNTPSPVRPPSNQAKSGRSSLSKSPVKEEEAVPEKPITPPPLVGQELCMSKTPKEFLSPKRFKNQYKRRLDDRMYQLLSDLFDDMDTLLTTAHKEPITAKDLAEAGFKKVRAVPLSVDAEKFLNAPLPPPWVKVSQRITSTEAAIRNRKAEVEVINWARNRH